MTIAAFIKANDAGEDLEDFARWAEVYGDAFEPLWLACPSAKWLIWLAAATFLEAPIGDLVITVCQCIRHVSNYDNAPREVHEFIARCERWADGNLPSDEVQRAATLVYEIAVEGKLEERRFDLAEQELADAATWLGYAVQRSSWVVRPLRSDPPNSFSPKKSDDEQLQLGEYAMYFYMAIARATDAHARNTRLSTGLLPEAHRGSSVDFERQCLDVIRQNLTPQMQAHLSWFSA